MDVCLLFYRILPDKTYVYKGESSHKGKCSKEWLKILASANMDNIKKLPNLAIESQNPNCFLNAKSLPCAYDTNKYAWMAIVIYEANLKMLDTKMRRAKVEYHHLWGQLNCAF